MKLRYLLCFTAFAACSEAQPSEETTNEPKQLKREIHSYAKYQPGDSCYGGMTEYDKQGHKLANYDYSECGVLFKKTTFKYDGDRIVQSFIECEYEDVTYDWIYNDKGQLIEKVATKPTSTFQYKLSYGYDTAGNQIEYIGTMVDGTAFNGTCRKLFRYKDGRKVETICFSGENFDVLGYQIVHTYDEDGIANGGYTFKDPNSKKADTGYIYYEYY